MKSTGEYQGETRLGSTAILIHFGLLVCGIAALLSGMLADDYKKIEHMGFTVHSWIGMSGAFFVLLRGMLGVVGPRNLRFTSWVPYTRERFERVKEDVVGLFRFRLPERPTHVGVAGLVQTFGLLVFLFVALSGIFLFFTLEPGHKAHGAVHAVKELHEAGIVLIPLFLAMHVGATVAHALRGRHLWRKMLFLKEHNGTTPGDAHLNGHRIIETGP